MLNKEELDFHPEFVAPYYGGLMNMNFASSRIMDNPHEFLLEVRSLKNKLSSEREIFFHKVSPNLGVRFFSHNGIPRIRSGNQIAYLLWTRIFLHQ